MLIAIAGRAGAGKDTVGALITQATGAQQYAFADPMKGFAADIFHFTDEQLWGPSEERNKPDPRFYSAPHCDSVLTDLESIRTFKWLVDILPPETPLSQTEHVWDTLLSWARPLVLDALQSGSLSPRRVLQELGTEFGRAIDPDLWLNCTLRNTAVGPRRISVITDCRFINEAAGVKKAGGYVWRVTRPGCGGPIPGGVANHASERDQDSEEMSKLVDVEIANTGTLDELRKVVEGALRELDGTVRSGGQTV